MEPGCGHDRFQSGAGGGKDTIRDCALGWSDRPSPCGSIFEETVRQGRPGGRGL